MGDSAKLCGISAECWIYSAKLGLNPANLYIYSAKTPIISAKLLFSYLFYDCSDLDYCIFWGLDHLM